MLRRYNLVNGRAIEVETGDASILKYIAPDSTDLHALVHTFGVDEHNLQSALDPDELGRLEVEDNGTLVLILKRPRQSPGQQPSEIGVTSVGICLGGGRMILVQQEDADLLEERMNQRLSSLHDVLLRILYSTINHFLSHLRAIHALSDALEDKIVRSMENRYLIEMFALEKSLVYYLNAVTSNARLLRKLHANASRFGFTEDQVEVLDDILIENEQCLKQVEIYSNIVAGLMDARGTIVGNNQNMLLRQLTILNIVFLPLNVLASIGGMSEYTMMTEGIPWPVAYSTFVVGMVVLGTLTWLAIRNFGMGRPADRPRGRLVRMPGKRGSTTRP
ncbi:MAG: magnesium transporter CorA family protein [Deltaproteobacteria bacterium]|nr:magnesium transporter CorA family protein [Deltaproteobacteria bacterium]